MVSVPHSMSFRNPEAELSRAILNAHTSKI